MKKCMFSDYSAIEAGINYRIAGKCPISEN